MLVKNILSMAILIITLSVCAATFAADYKISKEIAGANHLDVPASFENTPKKYSYSGEITRRQFAYDFSSPSLPWTPEEVKAAEDAKKKKMEEEKKKQEEAVKKQEEAAKKQAEQQKKNRHKKQLEQPKSRPKKLPRLLN